MKNGKKLLLLSVAVVALMLPAVAQDTPKKPVIAQRKVNQQKRIAQGVKSGQLTPAETAHLERQEARLNRETRRMRAANGGEAGAARRSKKKTAQKYILR